MMPSGLLKPSSPSQRLLVDDVVTSRGTWSRIAWINICAAASLRPVCSLTPMSSRAPSLQNISAPCWSNTNTASAVTSSRPTSCSLSTRFTTASVTSCAVPTYPVIVELVPSCGCVDTCIHITSPSGFHNRNSNVNGVAVSRARCHAASASDRSAGCALTHGAAP